MAAEDILILSDRDVMALAPMKAAVQVMKQTIISRSHGDLVSPPREMFSMDSTGLVWTPGGHRQLKAMGLRRYKYRIQKQVNFVPAFTGSGEIMTRYPLYVTSDRSDAEWNLSSLNLTASDAGRSYSTPGRLLNLLPSAFMT